MLNSVSKRLMLFSVCVLCGWGFAGIAEDQISPDRVVVYKQTEQGELSLHLFLPKEVEMQADNPRPAIVFFFGGGWMSGKISQFYPQSRYLSNRGMVAICADYRVNERHGTGPDASVQDAKSAIRWLRGHADELGIDGNRIVAAGGSAGGHLACATAVLNDFNDPEDNICVSCRPNALILFNPVIDNGPEGYGYDRVQAYWKRFSPIEHLKGNLPPALILLGTRDRLIPVVTARKFQQHYQETGAECNLVLYEGEPHGFFNQDKYSETLKEVRKFLIELGYLDLCSDPPLAK